MLAESKKLAQQITVAMVVGVIIGMVLNLTGNAHLGSYLNPIGTIFLKCLKMIIVPIVFCSLEIIAEDL